MILFLLRLAEACFAAVGAFSKAFAVQVNAEGELIPFRLDLGVAMWANVGVGEDSPIGEAANDGDEEDCRGHNYVPRSFYGFAKPVDLAGAKGEHDQKQKEKQCDLFHFFCPFLNSAGLKNS